MMIFYIKLLLKPHPDPEKFENRIRILAKTPDLDPGKNRRIRILNSDQSLYFREELGIKEQGLLYEHWKCESIAPF